MRTGRRKQTQSITILQPMSAFRAFRQVHPDLQYRSRVTAERTPKDGIYLEVFGWTGTTGRAWLSEKQALQLARWMQVYVDGEKVEG